MQTKSGIFYLPFLHQLCQKCKKGEVKKKAVQEGQTVEEQAGNYG